LEVLRRVKADASLRTIPVVILSASMSKAEAAEAYRNHANSFLIKPLDFDEFQRMVNDLLVYWGTWNQPG
jgi:CheY-like chemotaxis protein